MFRWFDRTDRRDHRLDGAGRITLLLASLVVEVFAGLPGSVVVVGDTSLGFHARAPEKVGAKWARLDDRDVDAKGREFSGERFRKAIERERSTSLQPTYEDSVPASDDDWEFEDS